MDSYYAELSASGLETVRFEGLGDLDCLCIGRMASKDGIPRQRRKSRRLREGRVTAADVSEDDIIYASRTVTLHWNANASTRQSLIDLDE